MVLFAFIIYLIYRRAPYSSYGDAKEPRPRSRSPAYGRDGREPRDSHEGRDSGRESRLSRHSRDPEYRYRSSESRDKDLRSDPRDPGYRWVLLHQDQQNTWNSQAWFCSSQHSREEYDRYYRGGADDYYRRKDEPYRDPYREPWNGRREPDGMYCQNQTCPNPVLKSQHGHPWVFYSNLIGQKTQLGLCPPRIKCYNQNCF